MTHLGRTAFETYVQAMGGVAFDGKPIPSWDELDGDADRTRGAWSSAAVAAVEAFFESQIRALVDALVQDDENGQTNT